jgi:hypothetical protein
MSDSNKNLTLQVGGVSNEKAKYGHEFYGTWSLK